MGMLFFFFNWVGPLDFILKNNLPLLNVWGKGNHHTILTGDPYGLFMLFLYRSTRRDTQYRYRGVGKLEYGNCNLLSWRKEAWQNGKSAPKVRCLLKYDNNFCFTSMSESTGPMQFKADISVFPEDSSYNPCKTLIYCSNDFTVVLLWIFQSLQVCCQNFQYSKHTMNTQRILPLLYIFFISNIETLNFWKKRFTSPLCTTVLTQDQAGAS